MSKLKIADTFFLLNESRRVPMHVAGLNLFTYPDGVDEREYIQELKELLHYDQYIRPPYGQVLKMGPLGAAGAVSLVRDESFDIDYHVRVAALPRPGRYRELFELVSRIHSTLLDRSRPLWEMYIIEGLQNRQFAIYFKVHHAVVDGVGAMHFMNSMLSPDPNHRHESSPFSMETFNKYREAIRLSKLKHKQAKDNARPNAVKRLQKTVTNKTNLALALGRHALAMVRPSELSVPWARVPPTIANNSIEGARRFVAQSWSFARIKNISKAYNVTLNDAVLAMCSGAIRGYLYERGLLPQEPLKAMVPVSLREEGDLDSANAIAFITCSLATDVADVKERVAAIHASTVTAKKNLGGMSKTEIDFYTTLTQAPAAITNLTGLAGRMPIANTIISNVPGPREQMYFQGARLDGAYPVSLPMDGVGVNFTLVSNYDKLDFGITACRRSAPKVQRLIDYLEESIVELEVAAGLIEAPARAKADSKPKKAEPKKNTSKKTSKKNAVKKKSSKKKAAKKVSAKKVSAKKVSA